jgi:hypothetical protein
MSQREFMIVLAHTHVCSACRGRLLDNPAALLSSRALTSDQKTTLQCLKPEDFITPDTLSRAAGVAMADLEAYQDEAVVRLRHL